MRLDESSAYCVEQGYHFHFDERKKKRENEEGEKRYHSSMKVQMCLDSFDSFPSQLIYRIFQVWQIIERKMKIKSSHWLDSSMQNENDIFDHNFFLILSNCAQIKPCFDYPLTSLLVLTIVSFCFRFDVDDKYSNSTK